MELARRSRSRLSPKEIDEKYGWTHDKPQPSTTPREPEPEVIKYRVQHSADGALSWSTRAETTHPVHALRLAREASGGDRAGLYRAFDIEQQVALLHFKGGMAVYEDRGWT